MKAQTLIHMHGGATVKTHLPLEEVAVNYARMVNSKPGSMFRFEKITDHGTIRMVYVPVGLITHFEGLRDYRPAP